MFRNPVKHLLSFAKMEQIWIFNILSTLWIILPNDQITKDLIWGLDFLWIGDIVTSAYNG